LTVLWQVRFGNILGVMHNPHNLEVLARTTTE
jgi:hypothetical protein